ncbi:glycoside hydrolase family 13 protein [Pontibacter sp. G13]|uniref:glycoside hydrolase family 13 protein n=1 Tax=Pontibacter sp. G13 TaxID=3074898 RepID=UPI00288B8F00|nr:glycoside hydrolase family 13 protein [Pontibacter sp. G13]WNJ19671.1 glycoside hydrolase family 13 protein [Pontibacter sp. G13]
MQFQNTTLYCLACLVLLPLFSFGQSHPINRVEPPFWWTGMMETEVELMVHGENISDYTVTSDHEHVTLRYVTKLENPNFLFLTLDISPMAQPGMVELNFERDGNSFEYSYELQARKQSSARVQGVSSEDFIYLLMPDRFANGDPSNDTVEGMHQQASREGQYQRHGGDIAGVIQHLDYLKDLGITTLWLNPVLENDQPYESYHGYAITDHYQVDARLGTNEQYRELVELCHERDMKLIQDVIYNHVGDHHWLIQDMPTKDWVHAFSDFTRTTYRVTTLFDPHASKADRKQMTEGWFDKHMPDLNQDQPQLANYLIQNTIWWVEYTGLDGLRIDTYAYPDQQFMAKLGKRLKLEFPTLTFFGETWVHGAAVQSWFTDPSPRKDFASHLDGVTDFQLYYAIHHALNVDFGWTDGVNRLYYALAKDYLYDDPMQQVVFLDNHDLGRFYDAVKKDFNKYKMGIGFLLTTRGIPQIYYGTEILMDSPFDHSNHDAVRREFPGGWPEDEVNKFHAEGRSEEEQAGFEYLQTLAQFRRQSPAITQGQLTQFVPEDGVYVYFRHHEDQTVMVLMNQQQETREMDLHRFSECMRNHTTAKNVETGEIIESLDSLSLPATSITILELQP